MDAITATGDAIAIFASPAASASPAPAGAASPPARNRPLSLLLVFINTCLVLVGVAGAVLLRVYFVHGGRRIFLSALLQSCGWPLLLPPILFRVRRGSRLIPPRLAAAGAVLGGFYTVPTLVYALGARALPLSTSSLLAATQLVFTAAAAFVLAGLRFTPFSVNAVVLLTVGPAVLGVVGTGPTGEASRTYWIGFGEAVASTALAGVVLPVVEVAMARYGRRRTATGAPEYATVMQMQAVMGVAGTAVCLAGMGIQGDFQAVAGEAAAFGLGKTKYYLVLVWGAVAWQLLNLGVTGLIACASSLLAGIVTAVLLPLSQVLAVVFLHEKFDGAKGIALVISLWGFTSYLYGEKQAQKKMEEAQKIQHTNTTVRHDDDDDLQQEYDV